MSFQHRKAVFLKDVDEYSTEDAMRSIFTFSDGNPRLVNRACMQSLFYGSQMKQACIDSKSVDIVLENEVTGVGH